MRNNIYTRFLTGLTMGVHFVFFLVREIHSTVINSFNNSCSIEGIVRANVILYLCNFQYKFPYYVVRKWQVILVQDVNNFREISCITEAF
jgi:hypothetical protein